ncbi:MAG: lysylphosphatidylglycerol synthase transmembrane domain-containing protein [Patescibacteria group bacterium]
MSNKSLILRLVISLLVLSILYQKLDFNSVLATIRTANLWYLLLSFLMICLNYIISGFRWRSLIFFSSSFNGRGVFKLIKLYFIGAFFNNFMPTSIGGDVYKAYVLGKNTNDMPKATGATFANRLSGLVILALLSTISLVVLLGFWGILIFIAFWILCILGFVSLDLFSRLIPKLKPFNDAIHLYRFHKDSIVKSLFFSLLVQIVANLAHFFATRSVGISITLPQAFFAFPIIGFLSFLPLSFNGIGIQDFFYGKFLLFWGISPVLSATSSLLYHATRVSVSLIGGFLLLVSNDKSKETS